MNLPPYNNRNIVFTKNENKPNSFCHEQNTEMFEMIA